MNELEGEYSVGEKVEEKIIKELKNINRNLTSLKSEHERFKNEYEKAHRVWTEEELEMELGYFKKQRKIREFLGQPTEQPLKDKRLKRKVSIHEMRKLNK